MSNDELRTLTNVNEPALFYNTGGMSLAIRVFAQVLGHLSPLPFPDVRGSDPVSLSAFWVEAKVRLDGDIYCPS